MIFIYLALFVLCFIGAKYSFRGFNTEGYLSRNTTDSIKGVFIALVFFSHFAQYCTYTSEFDIAGKKVSLWLGQLIVTMFLFYSGYGVSEAIKKKGSGYVKPFPKNRILKTLLHFDVAILLFIVMNLLLGRNFDIKTVLLSLVAWTSVGNSNWYIFAVLVLYAVTWIGFSVIKKNNYAAAGIVTLLTVLYVVAMGFVRPKEAWWYDTVLCYALGMWFSLLKPQIEAILTKNNLVWLVCTAVIGGGFYATSLYRNIFSVKVVCMLLFCLLLVILSLKFTVSNKILSWMGRYTFELFILQRIPMIVLKRLGLGDVNMYLFFFASLALTVVMSMGFRKAEDLLDSLIFGVGSKKSENKA